MDFGCLLEPWRTEEGPLQTWRSSLSEDSPLMTWAVHVGKDGRVKLMETLNPF